MSYYTDSIYGIFVVAADYLIDVLKYISIFIVYIVVIMCYYCSN